MGPDVLVALADPHRGVSIPGRWCLGAAVSVSIGVIAPGWLVIGASILLIMARHRSGRPSSGLMVLAVLAAMGAASAQMADASEWDPELDTLPQGRVELLVSIRRDVVPGRSGIVVGVPLELEGRSWRGPTLGLTGLNGGVRTGDAVRLVGSLRPGDRRLGPDRAAGMIDVTEVVAVFHTSNPLMRLGNSVRARVSEAFDRGSQADALMVGLLVGDTSALAAAHIEDLRRAGLAHFVAVSGSNVALFLAAWWLVGLPLAIHPRIRALFGLVGVAVFVIATRWEPSVVRAGVMAGMLLVGGLVGVPVDVWMALGATVVVLLLVAPGLSTSIGFILSVVATLGVLVGVVAVRGRRPRWLWGPLGATLGAQVAVSPIILLVFGTIPLLSPVANLLAAPVVALSTSVGMAAVIIPVAPLADVAAFGASTLLRIARAVAAGPQLGALAFCGVTLISAAAASRRFRPLALATVAIVVLLLAVPGPGWPVVPTVVVMDVGQGDAILIQDPSGASALVDGGRDSRVLDRALRRNGVRELDLVVVTHGDSDHAGGIVDLIRTASIGEMWVPDHLEATGLLEEAIATAGERGIRVRRVSTGMAGSLGGIELEVLSPARRYAADNDGSVVLLVSGGLSMLLPGDIEAVAQRDLPRLTPDFMVVPHHGSATTDTAWLERTLGAVAVLSYGSNSFGHPSEDVLEVLERAGSLVRHTHLEGDVVVPLG